MKKAQKVIWNDIVTGRTRYGVLREKTEVVAVAEADENLYPKEFKNANYSTWEVEEIGTGKLFALQEKDFVQIKSN